MQPAAEAGTNIREQSTDHELPISVASHRSQRLIAGAFIVVAVAYLAQIASPLRLINDGIDYLLQASSALDGHGFLLHGARSIRPPGYPVLVFLLTKAGLGTSWAIVALNCALLGIGCWASYHILRESFRFPMLTAELIVLLCLFSFLMVRNAVYPLSDIPYFGLSAPCLLALVRAENDPPRRRFWQLLVLLPLLVFCIEVRTIAVVMIPGFLWAATGGKSGVLHLVPPVRRRPLLTLTVAALLLVLVTSVLFHSRYMQFNLPIFRHRGFLRSVVTNLAYHTSEWGEMTLNLPWSRIPRVLGLPVRIVGVLSILVFFVGLWQKAKAVDAVFLYVAGGAGIVFAYPWMDSRLWLPFLPFLIGYILLGLNRMIPERNLRTPLRAYCALYCLLGAIALGFTTRLTFAGPRFPDLYGDGAFRDTYRLVLLDEKTENAPDIDPDALYLLQRFEPRARRK